MYHSLKKWVFNQALQQAGYFAVKKYVTKNDLD